MLDWRKLWKRPPYILLLWVQLAIFLICNIAWVKSSCLTMQFDSLSNLCICLDWGDPNLPRIPYPRVIHALTAILWHWGNMGVSSICAMQCSCVIAWFWATYGAGKEMYCQRTGFWAATLLLWSTQPTVTVRTFLLDCPLAAFFAIQFYCYLRSKEMNDWKWSLAFFALTPICAGVKYQYAICVAPMFVAISLHLFSKEMGISWGTKRALDWKFIIAQPLIPAILASYGFYKQWWIGDVALAFVSGMIVTSVFTIWHLSRLQQGEKLCHKFWHISHFLTYQVGIAISIAITIAVHTKLLLVCDIGSYAEHNICLPDFGSSALEKLLTFGRWCLGYLIEYKTKNLMPILFWLYFIGVSMAVFKKKYLQGYGYILFAIIASSLFFSLFTYNAPRFQAPLLSLNCIFAVYWIENVSYYKQIFEWFGRVMVTLMATTGMVFCGGWAISSNLPRIGCEVLLNDQIFDNGVGQYFYQFGDAYDPQRRLNYVIDKAKVPSNLCDLSSVWSKELWFTCDPYTIDWGECGKNMLNAMDTYDNIAYAIIRPIQLKSADLCDIDDVVNRINFGARIATGKPDMPLLPLYRYGIAKRYMAIISDPNIAKPEDWHIDGYGEPIYLWKTATVELRLLERSFK